VELQWQEPPERRRQLTRSQELDAIVAQLKAHPGRWALVGKSKQSRVSKGFYARGMEGTTRKRPDGLFDHYARAPK
jgi:hypothetical protein